jgi:chromosome segregation ATPase
MERPPATTRLLLILALVATATTTGCQWLAPQTRPGDVDVDAIDRAALQEEYVRLREHADRLQDDLTARDLDLAKRRAELEKQVEVNRLLRSELEATTVDLDYLESQFITLERRLSHDETKATAVAAIADAQLLQKKLRERHPGRIPEEVWTEVGARMKAAEAAMADDSFTAAVYHAHRALRLIDHTERSRSAFLASGTARIVSVSSANFREGPGSGYGVVGQFAYGTILVELDADKDWRRIRTRNGAEGWIHSSLIR